MRPSSITSCPKSEQPCLTLSEYLQNSKLYFTSNTTFHFLPGTHTVSETSWMNVTNVVNLDLIGRSEGNSPSVTIECKRKLGFYFVNVVGLKISSLVFLHCGLELPSSECGIERVFSLWKRKKEYRHFCFQRGTYVAMYFARINSLVLEHVHVMRSCGYGVLAWNTIGKFTVIGCKFHHNSRRADMHCGGLSSELRSAIDLNDNTTHDQGGNFMLVYKGLSFYTSHAQIHINISHSEFSHGIAGNHTTTEWNNIGAAGLGVYADVDNLPCIPVNIFLANCTLYNNTGPYGGNMLVRIRINVCYEVNLYINKCNFQSGSGYRGAGLYVEVSQISYLSSGKMLIDIFNSDFISNTGLKGAGMFVKSNLQDIGSVIKVKGCNFYNNSAVYGAGLCTDGSLLLTLSRNIFLRNTATSMGSAIYMNNINGKILTKHYSFDSRSEVINCIFKGNMAGKITEVGNERTSFNGNVASATLYLNRCNTTIKNNTLFITNNCTAIYATSSSIYIMGRVIFANNTGYTAGGIHINTSTNLYFSGSNITFFGNVGYKGGAIYINTSGNDPLNDESSFLLLNPNANIHILHNKAHQYGGGIYVGGKDCSVDNVHICFFQVARLKYKKRYSIVFRSFNISIILENNTAGKAGDSVYGGCLETCFIQLRPSQKVIHLTEKIFYSIFHIFGSVSPSAVASSPRRVCFCSNQTVGHGCPTLSTAHVFQGQQFYVHAVAVGQFNYASPAVVRSEITGIPGKLGERQNLQELPNSCGTLTYSILTSAASMPLQIFVESPLSSRIPPAVLHVTFLPCPLGFDLSGDPPKCDCVKHIRRQGVTCSITRQTIHRPAEVWIGNISGGLTIHTDCPFDYCKPENTELDLNNQDEQCSFNRTGVLCGACPAGLSLALGSSKCLECSNIHILLIIPFAVAGVALVFLLLKCNLTVSTGTVNGLIFYANIVRVNQPIFFPSGDNTTAMHILTTFIAWLNLDLGIQTCFFSGMNACISTWLQTLFPAYILIVIGFLVHFSRYSTLISQLTGANKVSVLATVLILSYAKCLRIITAVLSYTSLTDQDNGISNVWLLDGNVLYMKSTAHISLLVVCIIVILLYVMPFTLIVLLAPCLQARSNYRALHWVNRLKPLLDAYQEPYKNKCRYWTGLMLVVRVVLFNVFAGITSQGSQVNLFAIMATNIGIFTLWFLNGGRVYKSIFLDILDWFFLLNLQVLAATALLLQSEENISTKHLLILSNVMVGSAFAVFCGMICYHCYQEVRITEMFRFRLMFACCRKVHSKDEKLEQKEANVLDDNSTPVQSHTPTVSTVDLSKLQKDISVMTYN